MSDFMDEWTLLGALADAHNHRDEQALYRLINDEHVDFKNKPRCIEVAISAITLDHDHVSRNKAALEQFVHHISDEAVGIKTSYRLAILKQLLSEL